jgi:hypothetical protein
MFLKITTFSGGHEDSNNYSFLLYFSYLNPKNRSYNTQIMKKYSNSVLIRTKYQNFVFGDFDNSSTMFQHRLKL